VSTALKSSASFLSQNSAVDSIGGTVFENDVDVSSFGAFVHSFPLQGVQLYATLFERHTELVQTQKLKVAVANLEKIFTTTFAISSVSGFDKMSLRDLSKKTGMSMGGIYSCITKKEDIALMVADVVRLSSEMVRQHALKAPGLWEQIEQSIRFHLYASTLLQPWYFFLYFETRSLPEEQQLQSKQIELDAIQSLEIQIEAGIVSGAFKSTNSNMVANTLLVMLEDWYLKPWKYQSDGGQRYSIEKQQQKIDVYHQSLTCLVKNLLSVS
jgi:AcrR family transcriptional regulator